MLKMVPPVIYARTPLGEGMGFTAKKQGEVYAKVNRTTVMQLDLSELLGNMYKDVDGMWQINIGEHDRSGGKRKFTVKCFPHLAAMNDRMIHGGLDYACEAIEGICGRDLAKAGKSVRDFLGHLRHYIPEREYLRFSEGRGSILRPCPDLGKRAWIERGQLGS